MRQLHLRRALGTQLEQQLSIFDPALPKEALQHSLATFQLRESTL